MKRLGWVVHDSGSKNWALALHKCLRIFDRRLGSSAGFDSLPDDCSEGEHNRPCRYAFRPCYEFVPPARLFFVLLLIVGAALVCGYGEAGWIRLLSAPLVVSAGCLLLAGHRYWCEG